MMAKVVWPSAVVCSWDIFRYRLNTSNTTQFHSKNEMYKYDMALVEWPIWAYNVQVGFSPHCQASLSIQLSCAFMSIELFVRSRLYEALA